MSLAERFARRMHLEPAVLLGLAAGLVGAMVCLSIPALRFVMGYLAITVHEAGHTVTMWALGVPAIPAFDLRYGGGVSVGLPRSLLLACVLHLGGIGLAWSLRGDRRHFAIAWAGAALHGVAIHWPPLRDLAISAAGHTAELIVGAIFLFRALGGGAVERVERPLYALCGFFLCGMVAQFGLRLAGGGLALRLYRSGRAGMPNDLVLIERALGTSVPLMATALAVTALLTPICAYLAFRWRFRLADLVEQRPLNGGDRGLAAPCPR